MQKYFMTEPIYTNENKIVTLVLKNNTLSDNRVISEQKRQRIEKEFNSYSETTKHIIILLTQYNELTLHKICELLDIPENTVRYNLTKLTENGLIERHAK
jgi:Fic family protein